MRWAVLFLFLFSGCAGRKVDFDSRDIEPYIELFKTYSQIYSQGKKPKMPKVEVSFKKLKWPTIGICYRPKILHNYIQIDPEYWARANEDGRLMLIFHELGHCALNREHRDTAGVLRGNDQPLSLMHAEQFPYDPFRENFGYYMIELFNYH